MLVLCNSGLSFANGPQWRSFQTVKLSGLTQETKAPRTLEPLV